MEKMLKERSFPVFIAFSKLRLLIPYTPTGCQLLLMCAIFLLWSLSAQTRCYGCPR